MDGSLQSEVFLGMRALIAGQTMRHLMGLVERVAKTSAAVLITGESGTGKEILARAIHDYSLRSSKPWVDVDCATLPEHLVESELFGHERGAFSGADANKPGLFEAAHAGTLFLDEIGELPTKLQVKLLRVLDGVPYYRLGGLKKIHVDVRIVAATNQNLEQATRDGRFRSDLYHRLNQIRIEAPPLRERMEEVEPLAEFFLQEHGDGYRFSPEALHTMKRHWWPGNVRELRNAVRRAAALASDSLIRVCDLPPEVRADPGGPARGPASTLGGMERQAILEALSRTGGHHRKAAEELGISRRTLSRKLKLYRSESACETCMQ